MRWQTIRFELIRYTFPSSRHKVCVNLIVQNLDEIFRKAALQIALFVGAPWHFIFWCILVLIWAISGFFCSFSESWNFWANTSTTIFTFLICLLLQNTQNRYSKEIELKLDEIIRSISTARNDFIDLKKIPNKKLDKIEKKLKKDSKL